MRLAITLATAAATLAVAAPSHAFVAPVCTTRLVNATANTTAFCSSDNTPQLDGFYSVRVANVSVLAGVVKLTVTCGYGTYARTSYITVSGPQPKSVRVSESSDQSCRTELLALYDNTSAVATSTFTYQPIIYTVSE
jgi:hypothetical protein